MWHDWQSYARQDMVEDKDYKGRVVLLGDQVKDEAWEPAIFNDLGSAPVSMASGKFADYYGSLKDVLLDRLTLNLPVSKAFLVAYLHG